MSEPSQEAIETEVTDPAASPSAEEGAIWESFERADAGRAPEAGQDGSEPDADEPEAPAEPDEPDEPEAASPAEAQGRGDELWSGASAEQRAAFEAARDEARRGEQYRRSNEGRITAYQRQIAALKAAQASGAQQGESSIAQKQDDGNNAGEGFLNSEKWKNFSDEYPEVANPLGDIIDGLQSHTSRLESELSAILADRRQAELNNQAALLAGEYPDWQEVVAAPGFVAWLEQQPRHIQEAAQRNADEIVDAYEAADVVGRFRGYRTSRGENTAQGDTAREQSSNAALARKRAHQLEAASAARSSGPAAATGIAEDGDPESLWRQFEELERREARR